MSNSNKHHFLFRFLFVPILIAMFFSLFSYHAHASFVLRLTLRDLVQQSDLIVLGTCEEKTSSWDSERKKIFTDITLTPESCFKVSDCPTLIKVRQEGGTVDDITMTVVGSPQFRHNEKVILFLEMAPSSYYRVLGLAQGKFSVIQKAPGDKYYVVRNLSHLKFLKERDKQFSLDQGNQLAREADLDSFVGKIKYILELP